MLKNDYSFTYTNYYYFYRDNEKNIKLVDLPLFLDFKNFLLQSSMSTSSIIISRKTLGNIRFKDVEQEDYLFKCDLLKNGETAFKVKDTHVFYRINFNNRSSNKLKNILSVWKINKLQNKLSFFCKFKVYIFHKFKFFKKIWLEMKKIVLKKNNQNICNGSIQIFYWWTRSATPNSLALKKFKQSTFMFYLPESLNPVHQNFQKYNLKFVNKIEDKKENILIIPEHYSFIKHALKYKNLKKFCGG